ncbi:DUF4296 domain-containing protein [Lacinutrix salivirga]
MKHFLTLIIVTLCFTACYKVNKPDTPDNLIPEDKMVAIILDMSLFSSAKGLDKKTLQKNGVVPKHYVYTKHKIDSTQFALSNEYYAYNVKTYESIYARVKDSLNKLKKIYKELDEKESEEKRVTDSINKLKRRDSLKKYNIKLKRELNKPDQSINRQKPNPVVN